MTTSVFDEKNINPNNEMLSETLGETKKYWEKIKDHLTKEYGELTQDWKFYSKKSGWILKILRRKRNLFFFIPLEGYFRLSFVFGDKAINEIEKSDLPENIKEALRNARKYAEGRGLQVDIKSGENIDVVKKLVEIKVKN